MTAPDHKDDDAVAADVAEWFGKYFADRPAQLFALLGLAQIAARAMDGDSDSRQVILDGTIDSLLGTSAERMVFASGVALKTFLSVASGRDDPDPTTFKTDAVEWAQRWERARHSQ